MDVKNGYESVAWNHVIEQRNQWRALVNMIMNFQVV
jgi:hypothetical protein